MKQSKIFIIKYKNGIVEFTFYCSTIAAVIDKLTEQGITFQKYKLYQKKKEFEVPYEIGENLTVTMFPLWVHSNPNKGGDRTL